MPFEFVEATASDLSELLEFTDRVLDADSSNPFIVSFLADAEKITASLTGGGHVKYFIVRDEGTNKLVARCGIHVSESDDIFAYGDTAKETWETTRMVSLVGDLVDPAYRGQKLQAFMIGKRLEWLGEQGEYNYAVAGIIEENLASIHNFEAFNFSYLGEQTIRWDQRPTQTNVVKLFGRAI